MYKALRLSRSLVCCHVPGANLCCAFSDLPMSEAIGRSARCRSSEESSFKQIADHLCACHGIEVDSYHLSTVAEEPGDHVGHVADAATDVEHAHRASDACVEQKSIHGSSRESAKLDPSNGRPTV